MSFQAGDKVKVLNEPIEGVVANVAGNIVYVEVAGFDYPYHDTDLIKVNSKESIEFKSSAKPFMGFDDVSVSRKTEWQKAGFKNPEFVPKRNRAGVLEVDLHIGAIIHLYPNTKNNEALLIQLQHAEKWLSWAFSKNERRIVFIHGVGEGKLKQALYEKFSNINNIKIEDGSYKLYGYGAMELFLGY